MPTKLEAGPSRSGGTPAVALGVALAGDVPDSGCSMRASRSSRITSGGRCRRRWWRATWTAARAASAPARHGAFSQLLRGRAAALRVGRRGLETSDRLEPGGGGTNSLGPGDGAGGLGSLRCWRGGAKGGAWLSLAVAAFAVFPLTIRYGRAFQPDAAMLGAVVAGLGLLGSVSIAAALVLAGGRLVAGRARLRTQDHRRVSAGSAR